MTERLSIDGEQLSLAASRLWGIVADFEHAASSAWDASAHVGHDGLSGTVKGFADAWDIRRRALVKDLSEVAAIVDAINETFADLDREAAAQLTRAASGTAS